MDVFYLRPVSKKSMPYDQRESWYECSPIGREKLRHYLETMCKEAGMTGKKTNHSLRATGATALFSAGVPEKKILEVTGHRSNALELYERPSLAQKQAVSRILVDGKKSFADEMEKENTGCCSAPRVQVPRYPVLQPVVPAQLPSMLGSLFSGFSNCSVNMSPQNFVVNVHPSPAPCEPKLDGLLDGINLEDLF